MPKIYHPTSEDIDRQRGDMQNWKDAKLTNKSFFDEIEAEVASSKRPDMDRSILTMTRKGNVAYREHLKTHAAKVIENWFIPLYDHDAHHIMTRLGHTPLQEQMLAAFEASFEYKHHRGALKNHINDVASNFERIDNKHILETSSIAEPANERQKAIYAALAIYRQDKIAHLFTHVKDMPYEEQLTYAQAYQKKDNDPIKDQALKIASNELGGLHYQLSKISTQEEHAIIAVALGLKKPEETPYPKRLLHVQKILIEEGLLHDMSSRFADMVTRHTVHHPEKQPFDPEKFKTARERRGAPER